VLNQRLGVVLLRATPDAHGEVLERPLHERCHVRPVVDEKLSKLGVGRALRAVGLDERRHAPVHE
jgi:hypothetical protein